ncbi:MAG: glycosyltransferase family 87 protein [Bauldia sp.]
MTGLGHGARPGVVLIAAVAVAAQQVSLSTVNNYVIFRQSFVHLMAGADLYARYPAEHVDLYKYSPTFALFMAPFAALPLWLGVLLWTLLNALPPLLAVYRLPISGQAKAFVVLFSLTKLVGALQNTQSNGLVLALMIGVFVALEARRPVLAALATAAGAAIKLFGGAAGILFIFCGGKRRLSWPASLPVRCSSPCPGAADRLELGGAYALEPALSPRTRHAAFLLLSSASSGKLTTARHREQKRQAWGCCRGAGAAGALRSDPAFASTADAGRVLVWVIEVQPPDESLVAGHRAGLDYAWGRRRLPVPATALLCYAQRRCAWHRRTSSRLLEGTPPPAPTAPYLRCSPLQARHPQAPSPDGRGRRTEESGVREAAPRKRRKRAKEVDARVTS